MTDLHARLPLAIWPIVLTLVGVLGCAPNTPPVGLRDVGPPGTDAGPFDGGTFVPTDTGPRPDVGPPPAGDRDNDGVPDDDEAALGTDPDNPDSDGDGFTDGVEVVAGTNPADGASFIPPEDFYVILPYEDPAEVRELDFTARLGRADVFFLVDTTSSMLMAINNVRSSLSDTIVPALEEAIADLRMGVGDYRDFPVHPYGGGADYPFRLGLAMTDNVGQVQSALDSLSLGDGNDGPESQLEGYFGAVGGSCAGGGIGAACFRNDSHPIIVSVTDAPMHNDQRNAEPYSGVPAHSFSETMALLNANSVKVLGVAVDAFPNPIFDPPAQQNLEDVANATNSRSTGGNLTVYSAEGGEVDSAVVGGIIDLVGATTQDVTSLRRDDGSDAVDATRFIQSVVPIRASRTIGGMDATTFFGVGGGTTITFEVTFQNDFLPPSSRVQIFRAFIDVIDIETNTELDTRNVFIVVPGENGILI